MAQVGGSAVRRTATTTSANQLTPRRPQCFHGKRQGRVELPWTGDVCRACPQAGAWALALGAGTPEGGSIPWERTCPALVMNKQKPHLKVSLKFCRLVFEGLGFLQIQEANCSRVVGNESS